MIENGRPSKLDIAINIISVIPKIWNRPPVFQSMLLLMIFFTKSIIHSIKFCIPVGFSFKLLVEIKAIKNTIIAATSNIITVDLLNVKKPTSSNGAS
ncbi:hypothetical protein D3C79_857910 [compost metagenome]